VLHWINRILAPFIHLNTIQEASEFINQREEPIENTRFLGSDYPELDSIYRRKVLKTRVLVLNKDYWKNHEAVKVARDLADRLELRFGYSSNEKVMKHFDDQFKYLSLNRQMNQGF
jgi:hypothetical protein